MAILSDKIAIKTKQDGIRTRIKKTQLKQQIPIFWFLV
jgi:hypothetical protein